MDDRTGLTQTEILDDLRTLGVCSGDALEVHSSLSALGWVRGGADTVVDALLAAVGPDGALVMSAFPLSKALPVADEDRARGVSGMVRRYPPDWRGPTGMGVIVDAFLRRPGVLLGEGLHRVAAWGRDVEEHRHGFSRLLATRGKALLLGVGIYRLTSMHYAEFPDGLPSRIPPEVAACYEVPAEIAALYPQDILVFGGATPEPGWSKVLAEAERRGLVTRGHVGAAESLLFIAADVVGIYEQALRTDPYGLFGVPRPPAAQ